MGWFAVEVEVGASEARSAEEAAAGSAAPLDVFIAAGGACVVDVAGVRTDCLRDVMASRRLALMAADTAASSSSSSSSSESGMSIILAKF